MSTAPSETRKATGMLPCAGGLSGLAVAVGLSASAPITNDLPAAGNGIAANRLNAADFCSNSLLFMTSLLFLFQLRSRLLAFEIRRARGHEWAYAVRSLPSRCLDLASATTFSRRSACVDSTLRSCV